MVKKMDVPDIGGLLGTISKKRESGVLQKTPIQSVQPVEESPVKSKDSKTLKQENMRSTEYRVAESAIPVKGAGGRPTVKKNIDTDYVKISPRILKTLKKRVDHALTDEIFSDFEKRPIKTLDELVAFALETILKQG
ncbi:MAG: hypothetical protein ACYC2R_08565 [Burkholderiales bacterium]